ncbi:hypothetical protein [Phenylobacterium sp.]|uniref:hypothetical protein n=1 Tax=Phenylobacterium sp. TaxID=1871053 RepID=UPI002FC66AEC
MSGAERATALIDADPDIPSTDRYRRRFGTLADVYAPRVRRPGRRANAVRG